MGRRLPLIRTQSMLSVYRLLADIKDRQSVLTNKPTPRHRVLCSDAVLMLSTLRLRPLQLGPSHEKKVVPLQKVNLTAGSPKFKYTYLAPDASDISITILVSCGLYHTFPGSYILSKVSMTVFRILQYLASIRKRKYKVARNYNAYCFDSPTRGL